MDLLYKKLIAPVTSARVDILLYFFCGAYVGAKKYMVKEAL